MSKFDYLAFTGGSDGDEFVAHAKKYTPEQVVELFCSEYGGLLDDCYRNPTMDDIELKWVRWYIRAPESCGDEDDGCGCYSYCDKEERGAFPVYVITHNNLLDFGEG